MSRCPEDLTVLMLGGAKRVSLARLLMAAGERRGRRVRIVSFELDKSVPISCVGKVVAGCRWRDADVLDRLGDVIRDERVDVVLPFVDGAIEVCSRLRPLHPGVFIPVSGFEVAHAMFDKVSAAALFAEKGFPIPATYTVDGCRFPAILKPREGSASKGIVVAYDRRGVEEAGNPEGYLIQEYIADREEYTVDCYVSMRSGEMLCAVPRLRISTSGGEVDRTQTRRIPRLIDESRRVVKELGLLGPVTLQFIRDKSDGRYLLMEINPRLGGGVVCSILAGADIAGMIIDEAAGKEAEASDGWRDNALMARYFSEVMFYGND